MNSVHNELSLSYPVVQFSRGLVFPARDALEFTTCSKSALRNGFYSNLSVIDSSGRAWRCKSASKLHGVGMFWGYNIFLNQRIRITVEMLDCGVVSTEKLRNDVLRALRSSDSTVDDQVPSLLAQIGEATTCREIIAFATDAYFRVN
jgi:hypothetical protein